MFKILIEFMNCPEILFLEFKWTNFKTEQLLNKQLFQLDTFGRY